MFACIDDVLRDDQLAEVASAIDTLPFVDGAATSGFRATRVKRNRQAGGAAARSAIDGMVMDALRSNPAVRRLAIPRRIRPPLLSRYRPGMEYGTHVDDALMGTEERVRTDVSVTIFLSPPTDYDGGVLVIETPFGEREVKLKAGAAAVYPTTMLHRVEPVTQGTRLAAVTWIESHVRSAEKREILADLDRVRRKMAKTQPDTHETDLAFKTYANLLRRWSET